MNSSAPEIFFRDPSMDSITNKEGWGATSATPIGAGACDELARKGPEKPRGSLVGIGTVEIVPPLHMNDISRTRHAPCHGSFWLRSATVNRQKSSGILLSLQKPRRAGADFLGIGAEAFTGAPSP